MRDQYKENAVALCVVISQSIHHEIHSQHFHLS